MQILIVNRPAHGLVVYTPLTILLHLMCSFPQVSHQVVSLADVYVAHLALAMEQSHPLIFLIITIRYASNQR